MAEPHSPTPFFRFLRLPVDQKGHTLVALPRPIPAPVALLHLLPDLNDGVVISIKPLWELVERGGSDVGSVSRREERISWV
ncbi:MAG: hypothetical protein H5T62_08940 [Anaerolineae bacterium]|nr:hypothetical protein [Anaerolineae bacterium]